MVASLRTLLRLMTTALALGLTIPAAADELVLKNGQKVVGSIVGFENGMFRVETDFGVALVLKDKVASIRINASGEAATKNGDTKAVASGLSGAAKTGDKSRVEEPSKQATQTLASAPARSSPPPPVPRPLDEPLPVHLQEHLEGNTYVNDTFRFAMYKPPGWKIYEGVPRETGSGIMAMGTEDEQTLLIVDRQVWSGPPSLKADQVEARLRATYQDYQKLSENLIQCDGHPAIRRAFQGVLDGAAWHGIAVHVANGNTVFGILGLTSAEMFQFQQAVLSKIINSFHFLPSTTGSPGRPPG